MNAITEPRRGEGRHHGRAGPDAGGGAARRADGRPRRRRRPGPGARPGAGRGQGVRDLRLRPALRQARRRRWSASSQSMRGGPVSRAAASSTSAGTSSWATSSRPRSSRSAPTPTGPKPGTLVTSVPIMVSAAGVQDLAYSNDLPSGYSERMLLSAPLVLHRAQRPRRPPGRAHRADGGRAARGQQVGDRDGRGRGRPRLRAGRDRGDRRARPAGASSRSSPPTTRRCGGRWPRPWAPTTWSTRPTDDVFEAWAEHGGARGLVVFEAVGVPGVIDAALRAAPPQRPARGGRRVHGRTTRSPRSGGSPRSCRCSSASAMTSTSSPAPCGRSPRARSTSRPMITGEVGIDGVARRLRRPRQPRASLQDPGHPLSRLDRSVVER